MFDGFSTKSAKRPSRRSMVASYAMQRLESRQMLSLTVPNAPYAIAATPVSATEIDLTWHDNSNGAPISDYYVTLNGSSPIKVSGGSSATSFQATGLAPETMYVVNVYAQNAAGPSSNLTTGATTFPGIPAPTPTGYSISGTVFTDTNGNGKQDNGEAGLAGQQVYLDLQGLGHLVAADRTATSDGSGHYAFSNLTPTANYIVRATLPAGGTLTGPPIVYGGFYWVPAGSGPVAGKDFGFLGVNPTPNPTPTPTPTFTVADLGGNVQPFGINTSGQIAGALGATIGVDSAAFRTVAGGGPSGSRIAGNVAYGINDAGQAVGLTNYRIVGTPFGPQPIYDSFRTTPNGYGNTPAEQLPAAQSVLQATGINASGETTAFQPVFLDNPVFTPFRIPANQPFNATADNLFPANQFNLGEAFGVNASGQVTGWAGIGVPPIAFRTASEAKYNLATDNLGTLGGTTSEGLGINNAGQVIGYSTIANGDIHAFRTGANVAINLATDDLGTLGGNFAKAMAINSSGATVGQSKIGNGDLHAFYAAPGGHAVDLNTLVSGNAGWVFTSATAINDSGHIVGTGTLYGFAHGFELTIAP